MNGAAAIAARSTEADIHELMASVANDPLQFVLSAYPWGVKGSALEHYDGPDVWQRDVLEDIGQQVRQRAFNGVRAVLPIRVAVSSGRGVGKGALTAWLVNWIMSTRRGAIGTVTANTNDQLSEKTWAQIRLWTKRCVTNHWFEINSAVLYRKGYRESWKVTPTSCAAENAEAFQGQHNATSTSFIVFDEACHDDQTQVLTERGWLFFRDVKETDRCLTMRPDTGEALYSSIRHLHLTPYCGDLVTYARRGLNFAVTPAHDLWVRKPQSAHERGYRRMRADRLTNGYFADRHVRWSAPDCETFTIPGFTSTRKTHPPREVPFDAWAVLLGWYCSEGHIVRRANAAGTVEAIGVGITNRDIAPIVAVAEACGFHPGVSRSGIRDCFVALIHDRAFAEYLAQFGIGSLSIGVPDCMRHASARQINLFLDAVVAGDGYRKAHNGEIIYTSSERLAGDLQELIIKGGAQSVVSVRPLAGLRADFGTHIGTSSTDGFVVSRSTADTDAKIKFEHVKREHYEGMVYCAELPEHHLLFTRRRGTCMWSGNSGIDDAIFKAAEGGLTDGEPMIFLLFNPTRNSGYAYRAVFGSGRDRWTTRVVDARTCKMPNQAFINEWLEDCAGDEDADFFRVHVRGLPPKADELQFIDHGRIAAAQVNTVQVVHGEPLIAGVDVSGGGGAWTVCRFRRGNDARSIPAIRLTGEQTTANDRQLVIAALVEALVTHKPDAMFIDSAFGAVIVSRLRQLGYPQVFEVNFGAPALDLHDLNMRATMWRKLKEWLPTGAIDTREMDKQARLAMSLSAPGYHLLRNKLVLESKESMQKRGIAPVDDADSLALSFAMPVVRGDVAQGRWLPAAGWQA